MEAINIILALKYILVKLDLFIVLNGIINVHKYIIIAKFCLLLLSSVIYFIYLSQLERVKYELRQIELTTSTILFLAHIILQSIK